MANLIKNQNDWEKYKKSQESRVSLAGIKLHHGTEPEEFPFLVNCYIHPFGVGEYKVNYFFIYKFAAKKLLAVK